jgi:acyl-CoA thioester hydrolase
MSESIETYRGFVYPWEMDHVGHMNVQFYVRRFDEASWHFLFALGVGPSYLREHRRGVVALEQSVRYRREVLAGSLLAVRSRLLEIGGKTVRYVHTMSDCESGEEVAEMELLVAQIDSELRRSTPLPEAVVERGRRWLDGGDGGG